MREINKKKNIYISNYELYFIYELIYKSDTRMAAGGASASVKSQRMIF
jgi:hypothetical protein